MNAFPAGVAGSTFPSEMALVLSEPSVRATGLATLRVSLQGLQLQGFPVAVPETLGTAGGTIRLLIGDSTIANLRRAIGNGGLNSVVMTITFNYSDRTTHTHRITIPVNNAAFG